MDLRKENVESPVSTDMGKKRQAKFEAIVGGLSSDLYRYAYWICRDRFQAEDLVQETYLRAWKAIDSLRDANAAKSWLFTIFRREYARQFERIRPDFDDVEDMGELPAIGKSFDTSTEAFVLRRTLKKLPEEYREPLVLQVLGGFSCDDIAKMLNIKSGAVMTRLFRARKQMREMLSGDDAMPEQVRA